MPALLLALLIGCVPKVPPEAALEAPPKLPAPRAAAYVNVTGVPSDPVIARLARGLAWNESLSGAAAGLALNWASGEGELAAWEVREAAWQAGWAWPVAEVRGWMTPQAASPPQELVDWLATVDPTHDLGLVRARGARGDAWVGLSGAPRGTLAVQPRQIDIGGVLSFAPMSGAELAVADPIGVVKTYRLDEPRDVHVDVAGEWLVEVRDPQGLIALFPVYAGMVPPEAAVLTERQRPASGDHATTEFRALLNEVREIYGRAPYAEDLLIQSAANALVDKTTTSSASELAKTLGYDQDRTWKLSCTARTLADCADRLLWNPRARPALLVEQADAGLAAELVAEGVHVVVLVAAR